VRVDGDGRQRVSVLVLAIRTEEIVLTKLNFGLTTVAPPLLNFNGGGGAALSAAFPLPVLPNDDLDDASDAADAAKAAACARCAAAAAAAVVVWSGSDDACVTCCDRGGCGAAAAGFGNAATATAAAAAAGFAVMRVTRLEVDVEADDESGATST
jgi:hypothetical protein